MTIPHPWQAPEESPEKADSARHCPSERESERDRARTGAGDYQQDHAATSGSEGGEVVQFPRASGVVAVRDQPGLPTKLRDASRVWVREAGETTTAALDRSAWRARPPALRDIHTRAQRAEYAGDIPLLRTVGVAFGYVSLLITSALYALAWITRRPARLLVTTALVTGLIFLIF